MTLTLAMQFCERDLNWLKLHLPVYLNAFCSSGLVHAYAASDETNGEASLYLQSLGIQIVHVEFHDHWSDFWNYFLDVLRTDKVTKVLRLDPDEAIFPDDVPKIDRLLEQFSFLNFARVNYFYSRLTYNIGAFPDIQGRSWRLDDRIAFRGKRHEGIAFNGQPHESCTVAGVMIHHYGDASITAIQSRALRYYNWDRLDRGLPPVSSLPDDTRPGANVAPFTGEQPLDPAVVGKTAPYNE